MQAKKLGRSSLQVSPVIFGGNIFGWTVDQEKSFELLDAFMGDGFNTIDTADIYSKWVPGHKGGESETIIGNWIKTRGLREKILILTKGGADFGNGKDISAKNIIESAERSLKRLQTDVIDLYQSHYDDERTPPEETMEAYTRLVEAGKIRFAGTSNMKPQRIKDSLEASNSNRLTRYESIQPLYNLYDREQFESDYRDLALEQELGVIPYYALASGFLTGKYRSENDLDKSPRGQGVKKYLDEKGKRILNALDEVSGAHGATAAQVSIAWLIAQPAVTAAIASATSIAQLKDFSRAVNLELSTEEISKLTDAGS